MSYAKIWCAGLFLCMLAFANPYPDPDKVPSDTHYLPSSIPMRSVPVNKLRKLGMEVARISVTWSETDESYAIGETVRELSGTRSLYRRSKKHDRLGSYHGQIKTMDGQVWEDSIGTGSQYRKLVREITFRFPLPSTDVQFSFFAENPVSGKEELKLTKNFSPSDFIELSPLPQVDVKEIGDEATQDKLILAIYAEGYEASRKEAFFSAAKKTVDVLQRIKFPGIEKLAFWAVFSPSANKLGYPRDLGMPIAERNSFLSLYFPYWDDFGRWYHVVYPTREARFRKGLATLPYDYPLIIVDDDNYWGVGNYRELTAIPAESHEFTYLLTHEFGHFFGLNEEYEGGGPTELEFAPEVEEPWSQNITFLRDPTQIKWKKFVDPSTPLPTPYSYWYSSKALGAYKGGYAESLPINMSHKPVMNCTMGNGPKLCEVCSYSINERIDFDLAD